MKRFIAILLALVLCMSLFAACQTEKPEDTQGSAKPADTQGNKTDDTQPTEPAISIPLAEPLTLTVAARNDAHGDDQYMIDLIKKYTNVELQITRYDNFDEQYTLLLADNKLPDISSISGNYFANEYGPDGAYINIYEYLDQMPNLAAMLEKYPDAKEQYQLNDEEMYRIPNFSINGSQAPLSYAYRKDILDQHGLEIPTTYDEFMALCRKLKELYPESYPLGVIVGNASLSNVIDWGAMWGTHLTWPGRYGAYVEYDYNNETWYMGATSDAMKAFITWIHDMLDEGLMHPSIAQSGNDLNAAIMNGTTFISMRNLNVDAVNPKGKAADANFSYVMGPPIAMSQYGEAAAFAVSNVGSYNWAISANCENLDATLAFVDWMYSEEAIKLTNYGEEGVTHTVFADGNVVWNEDAVASGNAQNYFSVACQPFTLVNDFNALATTKSKEYEEGVKVVMPYATAPQAVPTLKGFLEDDQVFVDTYGEAYVSFVKGELVKFMLGERDLAEWDAFAKEAAETYHGAELVEVHNRAWAAQNTQ